MSDRINTRLPKPLAEHVSRMTGPQGLFETPSEYIRALIRNDMQSEASKLYASVIEGFEDIQKGRWFQSTGNWEGDKALLRQKEAGDW